MPRQDVLQLFLEGRPRQHAIDEIGAIERPDELRRILKLQLRHDVTAYPDRGRRGERVKTDGGPAITQCRQLAILRPEVVAPLADAVRLVYRDEADRVAAEKIRETVASFPDEPLRRDVKQAETALTQSAHDTRLLRRVQRAVITRR